MKLHSIEDPTAAQSRQITRLHVFGQSIDIDCPDAQTYRLTQANFGAMLAEDDAHSTGKLEYRIETNGGPCYTLRRGAGSAVAANTCGDLLFALEQSIVVELQRRRSDLYFIHAAVIERDGFAFMLVAESGGGKSTTTWALLQHGFRYLTDELAAVDVPALHVQGYPHALCLKAQPPSPYRTPPTTLDLGRTLHVPASSLPVSNSIASGLPLAGIFFVKFVREESPRIARVTPAEASAKLYVSALNALAHPSRGLDSALTLAKRVRCYQLQTGDLAETCSLVLAAIKDLKRGKFRAEDSI